MHYPHFPFKAELLAFYNRNLITLILCGTIIASSANLLLASMVTFLGGEEVLQVPFLDEFSFSTQFILAVFVAPFFETLIFQYLIISLVLAFDFKSKYVIAILISALAFASTHYYSYYYIGIMFIVGLLLAYFFIQGKIKFKAGFLVAFSIHAAMNLLSYIEL